MAKDPAYLFYPSDFEMGTMGMSFEQKGKYITLLNLQHSKKGYLKEKDIKRILNFNDEDDVEILEKFEHNENGYFNKRLLDEMTKRKAYSESRSQNRKGKTKETKKETLKTSEKDMKEEIKKEPKDKIPYKEIIDYLNKTCDGSYRYGTTKTQTLIRARWNEGFVLDDFIKAIDNSWEYWKDKDKTNLKPTTLFNGSFENRVTGQAYGWKKQSNENKPKDVEVDWLDDYMKKL